MRRIKDYGCIMSRFQILNSQNHNPNLNRYFFLIIAKSRSREVQWQNVGWKCYQKYPKSLTIYSANLPNWPIYLGYVEKNKPESVFGLQVRCRELDIFKILEFFWIFMEFFLSFFGIFLNFFLKLMGIFPENFFSRFCLNGEGRRKEI